MKRRIHEHLLWAGIVQAFASVLVLTAATALLASPLGYPPAELCYALAGIGVAILLGYIIEAVWMVGRAKRHKWHENWLGFVCGLGLTGLLGITLGLLVVLHPFFADRWHDD